MTTYTSVFGANTVPPSEYSYAAVTLSANTTFEWPQLASGDNIIAQIMNITASTTSLTMRMPAANQVSTASPTLIRNVGANTFTVADSTGSTITTVTSGTSKFIYITDNSTAAGTWSNITYGTGTSSADSASLAGYGTKATGATLSTMMDTSAKIADWTVATTDRAVLFVATGTLIVTLPTVASAADDFYFSVKNAGSGTLTVTPQSGELIDGAATLVMAPDESAYIVCTGAAWYTVGYGRSTLFQFTQLVKDISSGATLTSAEASNKLMTFTGTLTGNVDVIVPTVVAVYYLQNSYSGAYTATIKTAAGSGVATSINERNIVYCDGTNVVKAQTAGVPSSSIAGGVAGQLVYQSAADTTSFVAVGTASYILQAAGSSSPTWTQNLTVAQGGTGRVTGTTAYALIATGTTATGAQQTLAAGATTEILVGGGAAALPVWTTATGSGAPVRATSPTLVTPALGTPASGNLGSCTADGTNTVGFRGVPQNSQSADYTLVITDAGKTIYHPASDTNARTFTIPANASVAFAIGTTVTFINMTANVVTIAITSDTLYLASTGSTGSRSLARYGVATATKIETTQWIISGSALT